MGKTLIPVKGLNIEEALAIFVDLPSDGETDVSEYITDEEETSQILDASDISSDESDDDNMPRTSIATI